MATVVVIGEVVLDRFVTADAGVTEVAGGSAANTALAAHRAGHRALLRARYSTQPAGRFLLSHALALGLDVSGSIAAQEPATTVDVTLSSKGSPTYSFTMEGTADWQWTQAELAQPLPDDCDAIVLGSLASVLAPGCHQLAQWATTARASGVLVAYDPNARPTAVANHDGIVIRQRIHEWVRASDIVKVSDEDVAWIAPGVPPVDVARQWSTWGPKVVVLTGGPAGAWACVNGSVVSHETAPTVAVVDTVGAGDTLMAWLVTGLVSSDWSTSAVTSVLQRAVVAAAITCTRQGCQPPSAAEVTAAL